MSTDPTTVRPADAPTAGDVDPGPEAGGRGTAVTAWVTALVALALAWVQTRDAGAAVLAGVVGVIALVLGVAALVTAVRNGRRGAVLAVAAVVVSVVALALVLVTRAGLLDAGGEADGAPGAAASERGEEPGDEAADQDEADAPAGSAAEEPPGRQRPTTTTFGSTYTYDTGLAVTVAAPEPFEPSDTADAGATGEHLRFAVTITNGTPEPWTPTFFETSAASGGIRGTPVFDSVAGLLGIPPQEPLPPGGSVTFDLGYTVSDPETVVLEVTAGGVGYEEFTVGAG
ncbi:hypothetical protein [Cellulomonas telluris]|uniref:hypothetical protein n=1 Tax=Cellulomonas telluris TaxID=2306636 RepID=UPI0010A91813|nr:hypothetical protein [Cellulomonas telluris]